MLEPDFNPEPTAVQGMRALRLRVSLPGAAMRHGSGFANIEID